MSSSRCDLASQKFGSIYASLPAEAQRALFERHLLPLLDEAVGSGALEAALAYQTRFLGLPSLRLHERTTLTWRLVHDLERQPAHATVLDELTDTLALWAQDIFSVVSEYRTGFQEAHQCLLVIAKAVANAADACMGVAGCHCATVHLPFDVVFESRQTGALVRHVQVAGLDAFAVRVVRWLWRELFVGVLEDGGEKDVERWLEDVEDVLGWRGVVGVLCGGKTRWDDDDDDDDDETDDAQLPRRLRTLTTAHLTALFARAPCAELFGAATELSPASRPAILASLDRTALSSPDSLAPCLTILLHEHPPDARRIWALLDSGRHLLRPRDALTLQRLALTLGALQAERHKAQSLVLRELIQSARSVHAALLTIFPRLDEPRVRKDLARVLRIAPGETNRAQALRDWVRAATRRVELRPTLGAGLAGLAGVGVGVGAGPGPAQMAAIAQMMGFPVPPEALEASEEDDEALALGLAPRSREDRAEIVGLKERFNGWVDVAVSLGKSQVCEAFRARALLIKAYNDASAFVPYIKDTEVCVGLISVLVERGADSILDALDALASFAKSQRKREAAIKARREREAKEAAQKAASASGGAGPSEGGEWRRRRGEE